MKPSYLLTLINIPHVQINQCTWTVEFTLVYINFTREKQREIYNSILKTQHYKKRSRGKNIFFPTHIQIGWSFITALLNRFMNLPLLVSKPVSSSICLTNNKCVGSWIQRYKPCQIKKTTCWEMRSGESVKTSKSYMAGSRMAVKVVMI